MPPKEPPGRYRNGITQYIKYPSPYLPQHALNADIAIYHCVKRPVLETRHFYRTRQIPHVLP